MRLLITGACGFVGSELCLALQEQLRDLQITGLDNLSRRGSWRNLERLEQRGIRILHCDIRQDSNLEGLEPQDWLHAGDCLDLHNFGVYAKSINY